MVGKFGEVHRFVSTKHDMTRNQYEFHKVILLEVKESRINKKPYLCGNFLQLLKLAFLGALRFLNPPSLPSSIYWPSQEIKIMFHVSTSLTACV